MPLKFEKNNILKSFDGSTYKQPIGCKLFKFRDLNALNDFKIIPRGSCTSYVLACTDNDSVSVDMTQFNLITNFDDNTGEITVQSGVLISFIIDFLQSRNFIFPVVPGNPYATIGGAVAANVHGKNCYSNSVIYNHIISLKIILPSSKVIECFPGEPLFEVTVGGYGITGIILEIKLKCIHSKNNGVKLKYYQVKSLKEAGLLMPNLKNHDYLYSFHNSSSPLHNSKGFIVAADYTKISSSKNKLPMDRLLDNENSYKSNPFLSLKRNSPCFWNKYTISIAQFIFKNKSILNQNKSCSLSDFYFPLDQFKTYYYLFGYKGFIETQLLIPFSKWETYSDMFLKILDNFNLSSTVLSLKLFSGKSRLISFSGEGISLTADFPFSEKALKAFEIMDEINCEYGVKSNIIKDRRISSGTIAKQYQVNEFKKLLNLCKDNFYQTDNLEISQSDLLNRIL